MSTTIIDAGSLLAIDVGSVNTRVALFDIVAGRYRYLASGQAASSAGFPYRNIIEGIHKAIDQLQSITGRRILGDDGRLIVPGASDGSGIDLVCATLSAGVPFRVLVVGLLEEVSLESARRLAATTYTQVIQTLSMNDRRKTDEQIDLILRLNPDIIIIAGGTDGGASRSVSRLVEAVGLSSYLLPQNMKPEILFCGNKALQDDITATLGQKGSLTLADNIRPALDLDRLDSARNALVEISRKIRTKQIEGVAELDAWAGGSLLPTSTGIGRMIQYLSKVYDSSKGVLGIDVGSSALTLSAAFSGDLVQSVYPQLGLGLSQVDSIIDPLVQEINRWMHIAVPADALRNYLYNRSLYPTSIPVTPEELAIDQALARVLMQLAWRKSVTGMPAARLSYSQGLLPWFEPILVSGSVITRAPNMAQSMMMILDGIQPTGITTIGLDQSHLLAMLGAAATVNPLLAVQVLEANCMLNLGTVITPVGEAPPGTTALRLRLKYESGEESTYEVKRGTIEVIHLPQGQTAEAHVHPYHKLDVGLGIPGRSRRMRVFGGALGLVVDARGRPLRLPDNPSRRMEILGKWRWMLGC